MRKILFLVAFCATLFAVPALSHALTPPELVATVEQSDHAAPIQHFHEVVMHDKNGTAIAKGDVVNVPCRITEEHGGTDYCNVTLETVEPMHPGTNKTTITLNSKQVIRDDEASKQADNGASEQAGAESGNATGEPGATTGAEVGAVGAQGDKDQGGVSGVAAASATT
jgi:hypothetical protein